MSALVCKRQWARCVCVILCVAGLVGCATPSGQWRWPYVPAAELTPAAPPSDEARQRVEQLLAEGRSEVLLRELRQTQPDAGEDETLYQLGLLLLSPGVEDLQGAEESMALVLSRYPNSPRKRSAEAVIGLLRSLAKTTDNLSKMGVENRVLRGNLRAIKADMERIVNIDLETERQRLVDPPDGGDLPTDASQPSPEGRP